MSEITFEQILIGIQSLPPDAVARLRKILNAPSEQQQRREVAHALAQAANSRDLSTERQWLKEHCDEYAGQWVALKGDQLISHGADLKTVYAIAKAAGYSDALLEQVEAEGQPPSSDFGAESADARHGDAIRNLA